MAPRRTRTRGRPPGRLGRGEAPPPPGGTGLKEPAVALLDALAARHLRVAVAESCTGGLLAAALTDPPGASQAFAGGVVAYDNSVKIGLVEVQPRSLAECGAVSETVAKEMAQGARRRLGVDVGLSTTGIAGPDGGSPEKPVGTVWIGVATPDGSWAEVHRFDGDRDAVRAQTVDATCRLGLRHLP